MVRFPHTGTIEVENGVLDANGDFITNVSSVAVVGRFEPNTRQQNRELDYAGKFFCNVLSFAPFQIIGNKFSYQGVEFQIYNFFVFQNHSELWLK